MRAWREKCGCMLGVGLFFFFFQAEDGIRDADVTGVQTCALPISLIIESKTKGTAISFNKLMNIIPNGSIHLIVNSLQPIELEINAHITPSNIPIIIFQCKANFFLSVVVLLIIMI